MELRINENNEVVEVIVTESEAPISSEEIQRRIDDQKKIIEELEAKLITVKAFEEENNLLQSSE